jgi:uncharacterized DUF497 family protein
LLDKFPLYLHLRIYSAAIVLWTWDQNKDAANRRKHRLPLSIGEYGLADPLALTRHDPHPDGDRWNTICEADGVLLFVVHTWPDRHGTPGRIIGVRRATRQERRAYEEG